MPALSSLGAVWLCYGLPSVCSSESKVQDMFLLSNKSSLRPFLHTVTHQVVHPVARCVFCCVILIDTSDLIYLIYAGYYTYISLRTRLALVLFSFDSVSRCAMNRSAAWTASYPTPRLPNLCPNSTHSVHMDLCLQETDSHISTNRKSIF